MWRQRWLPVPDGGATVFVHFVAPLVDAVPPVSPPPPPPPQRALPNPLPNPLIAAPATAALPEFTAPELPPDLPTEPLPEPRPAPRSHVLPMPPTPAPVTLEGQLAAICPERQAPVYPLLSRRLGEAGNVVVGVELDAEGRVAAARIQTGSGFSRLDAAALEAVRSWRCTPARRDGRAVATVALQPFEFLLQGN